MRKKGAGLSVEPLLPLENQDFLRILEKDLYEKENTEDLILTFFENWVEERIPQISKLSLHIFNGGPGLSSVVDLWGFCLGV